MYGKLILQNAKRSLKDYLIYIVTMTICAALFYAFLSISSSFYAPDIGVEYNITFLGEGMKLAICGITLLIFFLIQYVNHYMLLHRKKEFAIQAVIGMEKHMIGWLFFAETLAMGAVAIILGIILGAVLSQFIAAMLLTSYGQPYHFSWMLFPDTIVLTICFFAFVLLIVGIGNLRAIRNIKIIDMLYADRKNEPAIQKSKYMYIIVIVYWILLIAMTATGVSKVSYYYDSRLPVPVRVMYLGNIAAPAVSLMTGIVCALLWIRRGKFQWYLAAAAVLAAINAIFAASVHMLHQLYYLVGDDGTMRLYLLYMLFDVTFMVCCIIYLASNLLAGWKEQHPACKYKNTNLFFFGQMISRLSTASKTMTLICLTLVLSCFLFVAMPALTGWAEGYLAIRARYDIQVATRYNSVYDEADLPKDQYEILTDFLSENGIETSFDCAINLYLTRYDDFHNRKKYDFPVVAIALSDYNALRETQGYEPVCLEENEFTTQWREIATDDDRSAFLDEHAVITTDAGDYRLSENPCYTESIGEMIYNSYTDVIYVFPDTACEKFLPVMRDRFITMKESIPYDCAKELENRFLQIYPEEPDENTGVQYYLRMRTLQTNESKASTFILQTSMTYGAIVLVVMCLTVLSLQQLSESSQYRYRFGVLHKLGVEQHEQERLAFKQLAVWFGLPILVAVLMSILIIACFFQTIAVQIAAYVGWIVLLHQVAVMAGILGSLLLCYFIITYMLFKPVIYN
ncbi:MAG: ABC transporter permease [Lachnospiraceae bacterium]|nr:ABC transporter permease [Lachnospiraceae bacterium]